MANNKRNKRNGKTKRQRGKQGGLLGFQTMKSVIPDTMTGWCTYGVTVFALAIPVASLSGYVFRLNSIFDPDYTSVGGRSVGGYAQLAALYSKYRVLKARIHIEAPPMITQTESAFARGTFIAAVSDDVTLGTTPDQWMAQRHVFQKTLGTYGFEHTMEVPIGRVFGVPRSQVSSEGDFGAAIGTNPTNVVYLHTGPYNLGGTIANHNYTVRIEFLTRFEKPIYLS